MAKRPKHDPEESLREILDAAEAFLREHPFRELTVDALMNRTGLKRPSFYSHFRDRHDLVLRLVDDMRQELAEMVDRWLDGDDFEVYGREAFRGLAEVYQRHGRILRAVNDAASSDATIEAAANRVFDEFVEATHKRIVIEQQDGRIRGDLDAEEMALALCCLDDSYLRRALTLEPIADPERVIDVLMTIWTSTLYGSPPS